MKTIFSIVVSVILVQLSHLTTCQSPSPYVSPIVQQTLFGASAGISNLVIDQTGIIFQTSQADFSKRPLTVGSMDDLYNTYNFPTGTNNQQMKDFIVDYYQQQLYIIAVATSSSHGFAYVQKYDTNPPYYGGSAASMWSQTFTNWAQGGNYQFSASGTLNYDKTLLMACAWAGTSPPYGYILSLNATSGSVVANVSVPCGQCVLQKIVVDNFNNIYLSGIPNSNSTVAGTLLVKNRPFLIKMNGTFTVQWATSLPVSLLVADGADKAASMVIVGSSIYLAGTTRGNISGCSATFSGSTDGFIAQYDMNGALLKSTLLGSTYLEKILLEPMGFLFSMGYTTGNFDNSSTSANKYPYFARYDLNLIKQWTYIETSWYNQSNVYVTFDYDMNNGNFYALYMDNSYIYEYNHLQYVPTPSITPSISVSPSKTPSLSPTPSQSPTMSVTPSVTPSISASPSRTPSRSVSPSLTPTPSVTPTFFVSHQTHSNLPLIVGAVVGGVVGLAIFATLLGVVLVVRKKNRQRKELLEASSLDLNEGGNKDTQERWKIEYDEIEMGAEIGQGAFGAVYKARWRNCDCVVKQLHPDNYSEKAVIEFLKEASTVQNLRNHKNVCSVFGVCNDPNYPICIVLEYVSGGSLKDLVYQQDFNLTVQMLISFAKDIASGMSHLHKENFLHCDLACRNLLIENSGNDQYTVKVADFGLTRHSAMSMYIASEGSKFPIRWSAPEILTRNEISKAADVWSFGVVLWEIMEGRIPYYHVSSNEQVVKYVCEEQKTLSPPTRFTAPQEILDMMLECWNFDPASRPSFDNICNQLQAIEQKLFPNTISTLQESQPVYQQQQQPHTPTSYEVGYRRQISSSGAYGNADNVPFYANDE